MRDLLQNCYVPHLDAAAPVGARCIGGSEHFVSLPEGSRLRAHEAAPLRLRGVAYDREL